MMFLLSFYNVLNRKAIFSAALVLLFFEKAASQNGAVLTFENFIETVFSNHPVARQAALLEARAEENLRSARGRFDPILKSSVEQKTFDGKTSYRFSDSKIELPAWPNMSVKAGYETADGPKINPEHALPSAGQAYFGASVGVLQNLRIDERRAALFQARNLAFLNEAERRAALNNLAIEAAKTYWAWAFSVEQTELRRQFLATAQTRFEAIKEVSRLGDRPAIDTLEAALFLLERQADLLAAEAEKRQNEQLLNAFLWQNDGSAAFLADGARPVFLQKPSADGPFSDLFRAASEAELNAVLAAHPELQSLDFQQKSLDIERRLKAEKVLPKLDLSYNFLGRGAAFALSGQNKWSVDFGWQLGARTARAELELQAIKQAETRWKQAEKRQNLLAKLRFYQIELQNLDRQMSILEVAASGYRRLLEAENERFLIGESSVFLINAREQKSLEADLKLLKIFAEIEKNRAALRWAAGRF